MGEMKKCKIDIREFLEEDKPSFKQSNNPAEESGFLATLKSFIQPKESSPKEPEIQIVEVDRPISYLEFFLSQINNRSGVSFETLSQLKNGFKNLIKHLKRSEQNPAQEKMFLNKVQDHKNIQNKSTNYEELLGPTNFKLNEIKKELKRISFQEANQKAKKDSYKEEIFKKLEEIEKKLQRTEQAALPEPKIPEKLFFSGQKNEEKKVEPFSGTEEKTKPTFSFGNFDKKESEKPEFSFGKESKKEAENSSGFTFGTKKPKESGSQFSFGSVPSFSVGVPAQIDIQPGFRNFSEKEEAKNEVAPQQDEIKERKFFRLKR